MRLERLVDKLGQHPNLSLPAALRSRAELAAAYRFFANEHVTPQALLEPHMRATIERIVSRPVVLLVQDTSDIDLTRPSQQVHGAGPMECSSHRGAFLHPLLAIDPEGGVPLGLTHVKLWARTAIKTEMTPGEKRKFNLAQPIEEKESMRWVEGVRAARDVAMLCVQTTCVCVSDSEADIYEVLCEPRTAPLGRPLELLVRACQPRALANGSGSALEAVRATPCRYTCTLEVAARRPKIAAEERKRKTGRDARQAQVAVRTATVTLRPPARPDRVLPQVTYHAVLVEETDPPPGCEPLQWLLLTTLPIESDEDVRTVIGYYCHRWGIEVFFKTLKSGCRVEDRQFEFLERELNCLAIYLMVAWRTMMLCRLGRMCPDLDCDLLFEPSEWKAVYMAVHRRRPPLQCPKLNDMIQMVASLGGYVRRKNAPPGTQTLWIGLQRMHDFAKAWELFGPECQHKNERSVKR